MPKTDFVNGDTVVTAEWLDAIQEHVHDGADVDGSAPKVSVPNHLDWGDEGYLQPSEVGGTSHLIEHKSDTGAITEYRDERITAKTQLRIGGPGGNEGYISRVASAGDTHIARHLHDPDSDALARQWQSGSFAPLDDEPPPSSALKHHEGLFKGNLPKLVARIRVKGDGAGAWLYTVQSGSYNVGAVREVTVGSTKLIEIDAVDDFAPVAAAKNVGFFRNGGTPDFTKLYTAHVDIDAYTAPKVARVAILHGATLVLDNAPISTEEFDLGIALW